LETVKKLVAVLVAGILIGWSTEYAYLRYQAAQAEKSIAALMDQIGVGKLPTP
jgi:hypothetical protein